VLFHLVKATIEIALISLIFLQDRVKESYGLMSLALIQITILSKQSSTFVEIISM